MTHHFNPSAGGHAPGHLRGFFWALLDLDEAEAEVNWPKRLRPDVDPLAWVAGQLHNCTDTMPGFGCEELDLPRGASYAVGARFALAALSRPESEVGRAAGDRVDLCNQVHLRLAVDQIEVDWYTGESAT